MKGLTERQKEILCYITKFKEDHGVFPSLSEIAHHFNFSIPAAHYALSAIEDKGFLSHEKGEHRAYLLSAEERSNRENTAIPFYSSEVSEKSFATPDGEVFIPIAERHGTPFAYRVKSTSMMNAGILPGDIAIMDADVSTLKDGDIVLPLFAEDDRMVLRRYRKTPSFIQLEPENDEMGIIRGTDIAIFAILRSIRRFY